ncbi:uncharacterized protein LOC107054023 [Gallus gallus]|uniref:uncharacterized protein LOC107054023 n=1 Tax=Gallus gallus TaxID=9031 RepID=UPI001AEA0476|nr:uncharacterized protein LOC107054023 [Gallus gallus]
MGGSDESCVHPMHKGCTHPEMQRSHCSHPSAAQSCTPCPEQPQPRAPEPELCGAVLQFTALPHCERCQLRSPGRALCSGTGCSRRGFAFGWLFLPKFSYKEFSGGAQCGRCRAVPISARGVPAARSWLNIEAPSPRSCSFAICSARKIS